MKNGLLVLCCTDLYLVVASEPLKIAIVPLQILILSNIGDMRYQLHTKYICEPVNTAISNTIINNNSS